MFSKDLARFIPLTSVRSQSALAGGTVGCSRNCRMRRSLGRCNSRRVCFRSALSTSVAENRCEHLPLLRPRLTADPLNNLSPRIMCIIQ